MNLFYMKRFYFDFNGHIFRKNNYKRKIALPDLLRIKQFKF